MCRRVFKGYSSDRKLTMKLNFLRIRLCFINAYTYSNLKFTLYNNANYCCTVWQKLRYIDVRMPSSGSFIPSSHKRAGLIQSRVLPLPRPCKLRFTQSPFQGKSVYLVAIFPMPLGSCFRHARPSPIYLNEEILKSTKSDMNGPIKVVF